MRTPRVLRSMRGSGPHRVKGRGAGANPANRYASTRSVPVVDDWFEPTDKPLRTTVSIDHSRRAISYNESPDVPFDRSVNPYRGCEHGCCYCYARPSHAWLDLSPGLDFESRLFARPHIAEQLRDELAAPGYRPATLAISGNTDAYQPIEREHRLTRAVLGVLRETRHPCQIITKSSMIERDIDLLAEMAELDLVNVAISLTTLDRGIARTLEPRASAPHRRLRTIERLAAAGIPVTVLIAPVIPVLTDSELERLLQVAREHGARDARYVLIRLPLEVAPLFEAWLRTHAPGKADHVMARIRDCRGDRVNDPGFGTRMTGTGVFADLIRQRFDKARRWFDNPPPPLRTDLFRPPARGGQYDLFLP